MTQSRACSDPCTNEPVRSGSPVLDHAGLSAHQAYIAVVDRNQNGAAWLISSHVNLAIKALQVRRGTYMCEGRLIAVINTSVSTETGTKCFLW